MNTIPPDFLKYLSPETIAAIRSDLAVAQATIITNDKFTSRINKDTVPMWAQLEQLNSYLAQVKP